MIDARELRIGNWVNTPREDQNPFRIDEFELMDKSFGKIGMTIMAEAHPLTWYLEHLQPIHLTPEVLERCGFVKESKKSMSITGQHFSVYTLGLLTFNTNHGWWINGKNVQGTPAAPKHLHQLQNLYYALTGTEVNYTP